MGLLSTLEPPRHMLLRLNLLYVANFGDNFQMVEEVLEFYILTERLADFTKLSDIAPFSLSLIC